MPQQRECSNWIESYLEFTDNSEPPYLYRKWVAINVIAACLRRKCYLPWGSETFFPNMYIVLVGPPGKARKGTAMKPGQKMLRDCNIKLAAESITREALVRELKNSSETIIDPKTGEMEFHSSLTVFSKELSVFLGYNNQQLMMDLTDWFDCDDSWTYRTKHQGTDDIIGVWLNLIGATTPQLIRTSMPSDAIGLGLASRIVFVYEHKKAKTVVDPFPTKYELELRYKLMDDLDRIKMIQGPFQISEDFILRWSEWYPAQDDNPPFDNELFAGYFERRGTHVMKLSIIMNVARTNSMVITRVDLDNAIKLLIDTEVKMPYTFSGIGKSSHAEVLSRVMIEVGQRGEVKFGELVDMFKYDASGFDMRRIIETLEMSGYATKEGLGTSEAKAIIKYNKEEGGDEYE